MEMIRETLTVGIRRYPAAEKARSSRHQPRTHVRHELHNNPDFSYSTSQLSCMIHCKYTGAAETKAKVFRLKVMNYLF